jgi:hypothetical protein
MVIPVKGGLRRHWLALRCKYDGRVFDTIPQLFDYYKDFEQGAMDQHLDWDANEESLFVPGVTF